MFSATLNSPVGPLLLFADSCALHRIVFSTGHEMPSTCFSADDHPLLCNAKAQLEEYFAGQRRVFDLPLLPKGTIFQQEIWTQIALISYGETRSYGEIATLLGDTNKARAVGSAAGKNPLPIVIPCHRVIGSSGKLIGFTGGLQIKEFLLALEKNRTYTVGASL